MFHSLWIQATFVNAKRLPSTSVRPKLHKQLVQNITIKFTNFYFSETRNHGTK